jgi:hypothetical protein
MLRFEDLIRTAVVPPCSFTAIVSSEGFAIVPAMPIILRQPANDNFDTKEKENA